MDVTILQKEELLNCLDELNKNSIIIDIYGNDNIIFEKNDDIHFATVESEIERILGNYFGRNIYITTISMNTIKNIVSKFK